MDVGYHSLQDDNELSLNGLDKSCEATIYPVLDKPPNAGALGGAGASNYRCYPPPPRF
jgi:hypothetical protein